MDLLIHISWEVSSPTITRDLVFLEKAVSCSTLAPPSQVQIPLVSYRQRVPWRLQGSVVEVTAAAEASLCVNFQFGCWWFQPVVLEENQLNSCGNSCLTSARYNRKTGYRTPVRSENNHCRWSGNYLKKISGQAMSAWTSSDLVGERFVWYFCTHLAWYV